MPDIQTVLMLSVLFLLLGCIQQIGPKSIEEDLTDAIPAQLNESILSSQFPLEINESGFNETYSELENLSAELISLPTIYYYHSTMCAISKAVRPTVDSIHEKFNKSVVWKEFNVVNLQGLTAFNKHTDEFNIPNESRLIPMLIIGNKHFVGIESINGSIPINETVVSAEISRWLNNETDSS